MTTQSLFETESFPTMDGNLIITFLGHGSLKILYNEREVYIDPYSRVADYSQLPPADLILITHDHSDHFDLNAIAGIRKDQTIIVLTAICAQQLPDGIVMKNGDERVFYNIGVKAFPAYNMIHKRDSGVPYHPRGEGNGYLLTIGGMCLYVAGDTENIPEMKALRNVDCAFLPMNLPYTMTPEMVADAARAMQPKILYPYHFGNTKVAAVEELLKSETGMEVRIRKMA